MNFINNKNLRNFIAFILEMIVIGISILGIYDAIIFHTQKDLIYWVILIGLFVIAIFFKFFARRLWVTKVCPNCCENRALVSTKIHTGSSKLIDIVKKDDGYHKIYEEEYEVTDECQYGCGFKYVEYKTEERDEKV